MQAFADPSKQAFHRTKGLSGGFCMRLLTYGRLGHERSSGGKSAMMELRYSGFAEGVKAEKHSVPEEFVGLKM